MNWELPDVQAGFRKSRRIRDCKHLLNLRKSKRISEKHLLLLYWLCQSFWLCGSQQTVENSSRDRSTFPPASCKTCVQVKKQQLELDMEQQTSSKQERNTSRLLLSSCLFNFYAEYIMWNARLGEAQAGIKVAGKNINNLIYADDTTLTAEREEELKSLLMKVKESEKVGLKQHSEN